MEDVSKYPSDLDDAIEILKIFYKKSLDKCLDMSEQLFINQSHHMAGAFVRNEWTLWWYENHQSPNWPKEKPIIVQWFNNLGITHADDMSGIIMRSLFRNIKREDLKLDDQINSIKDYWKRQGYKDGIFKM